MPDDEKKDEKQQSLIQSLLDRTVGKSLEWQLFQKALEHQDRRDSTIARNWDPNGEFSQLMESRENELIRQGSWEGLINELLTNETPRGRVASRAFDGPSQFPIYRPLGPYPPREHERVPDYPGQPELRTPTKDATLLTTLLGPARIDEEIRAVEQGQLPYSGEGPQLNYAPRSARQQAESRHNRARPSGAYESTNYRREVVDETIIPKVREALQQKVEESKVEAEAGGRRTARVRANEPRGPIVGPAEPTLSEKIASFVKLPPVRETAASDVAIPEPSPETQLDLPRPELPDAPVAASDAGPTGRSGGTLPDPVAAVTGAAAEVFPGLKPDMTQAPTGPSVGPYEASHPVIEALKGTPLGNFMQATGIADDPFFGADPSSALKAVGMFLTRGALPDVAKGGSAAQRFARQGQVQDAMYVRGLNDELIPKITNHPVDFVAYDPTNPVRNSPMYGQYQLERPSFTEGLEGRSVGGQSGLNPFASEDLAPAVLQGPTLDDMGLNLRVSNLVPDEGMPGPSIRELMLELEDVLSEPELAQTLDAIGFYRKADPLRYRPIEDILGTPPSKLSELVFASEDVLGDFNTNPLFKRRYPKGDPYVSMDLLEQEFDPLVRRAREYISSSPPLSLAGGDMLREAVTTGPGFIHPRLSYGTTVLDNPTARLTQEVGTMNDPHFQQLARRVLPEHASPGGQTVGTSLLENLFNSVPGMVDELGVPIVENVRGLPISNADFLRRRVTSSLLDQLYSDLKLGL